MLQALPRVRRTLPLFGGVAALYLACWLAIRVGVLAREPDVLAGAVAVDLTLTATVAVWWFGVRRGLLPGATLIATLAMGFGVAMVMLPQARGMHLRALGCAWAALELAVLCALLSRIHRVTRAVGRARSSGAGLPEALERGIATALPQPVWAARVLAHELCVVRYGVWGWFDRPARAPAGERLVSHPGLSQWRALVVALGLLLVGEGFASHVLLSMWSHAAAWVCTGSELYALLWLLGDYQLLRLNPLRLTAEALHVELGLRGRAVIPLHMITRVRPMGPGTKVDGVMLKLFGDPDVVIELNTELEVTRGFKPVRSRTIVLRAGAFAGCLRQERS